MSKKTLRSVNFPNEIMEKIKKKASQQERSFNAQVIFILKKYLENQSTDK